MFRKFSQSIFFRISFSCMALLANIKSDLKAEVPSAESIKVPSSIENQEKYDHTAPYLVVSCMDFRLRDELAKFMELRVGADKYDEIVLPGASLGVVNDQYPHWKKTFIDVLTLATKLHKIHTVILIDHRDCGAYKLLKGKHCCDDRVAETIVHKHQFDIFRKLMKEKFPHIKVETLLMGLDGQVETIKTDAIHP